MSEGPSEVSARGFSGCEGETEEDDAFAITRHPCTPTDTLVLAA